MARTVSDHRASRLCSGRSLMKPSFTSERTIRPLSSSFPRCSSSASAKHHHGASRQHLGKRKFVGGIGVPSRVTDCSNASIERKASAEAKPSMVAPLVRRYVRTPFSSSL